MNNVDRRIDNIQMKEEDGETILFIDGRRYQINAPNVPFIYENAAKMSDDKLFDLMAILTIVGDKTGVKNTIEAYKLKKLEERLL